VPFIESSSAVVAWGTYDSFGDGSAPLGRATVRLDGDVRATVDDTNWYKFEGLDPDRRYEYCVELGGETSCDEVRTYPTDPDRLAFLVIGDFGEGNKAQRALGQVMASTIQDRQGTPNPIRFVLTVGDNVYRDGNWFAKIVCGLDIHCPGSGNEDSEWRDRFLEPYRDVIASIPFYPTLGNHDGDETEEPGDLKEYVDNFFLVQQSPSPRYYSFRVGALAEFFALDTTENADRDQSPMPRYTAGSAQDRWLKSTLSNSEALWKIPYFHHPPLTAGPRHPPFDGEVVHFLRYFEASDIQVVFTGHEHNLQLFRPDPKTGGIRYIVTGAGGALREGAPGGRGYTFSGTQPTETLADRLLDGWAAERHFLVVELDRQVMTIDAYGTAGDRVRLTPGVSQPPVEFPVTIRRR
jgi:hypothetical protein